MLLIAHGADLWVGIEAAKGQANRVMLGMLNQIKCSREEKDILLAEVPKPHRATQAGMIRMRWLAPHAQGCYSPESLPESDICNKIMGSKTSCRTSAIVKKKTSQTSPDEALLESVRMGDVDRVKDSLSAGADIHVQSDYALRCSAGNGHLEVVRLLIDRDADIHAEKDSALRWASFNGRLEVIRLLLDRGADIHAEKDSALRWASLNGHFEVVRLLLDSGADVLVKDNMALRNSVANGHFDIAMLLIAHGADLEVGIEAAKGQANRVMLGMLNQIKCSREEKDTLLSEVPLPAMADKRIRM